MRHREAILVIAWGLPVTLTCARADDSVAISHPKASSGTPLILDYSQGHIDAQITAMPLRRVLSGLSAKTGLQTRVSDPQIGDYPVTSTLQAVPLTEAIAELLDGFSYAMYAEDATLTLSVLSTPPKPKSSPISVTRAISPAASQGALPADPRPPDTPADERETDGPESLEEFEPITMEEPFTAGDEGEDTDRASSADNLAYNEALLQRALNALGSEHKHLHPYAIEQLADLKDPRATQALIDVALNGAKQTPQVHRRAVAALSQRVEQLGSADTASANALKQLSQDSDQEVRNIASQALQTDGE
jgi:HEAT repeats